MKSFSRQKGNLFLLCMAIIIWAGILLPSEAFALQSCSIGHFISSPAEQGSFITISVGGSSNNPNSQLVWGAGPALDPIAGVNSIGTSGTGSGAIIHEWNGTPTTCGDFNLTATVHDNDGKCTDASLTEVVSISCPVGLQIQTLTLSVGQEGAAYLKDVVAMGGIPGYTWSITSGSLPAGLVLSDVADNGRISGTPAAGTAGNYTIEITVTDSIAATASETFVLTINAATPGLQILTTGLPDGDEGTFYSYSLSGTGGVPPYTWSATGLPTGLTVNPFNGLISGTPTSTGSHTINVTLSDNGGSSVNGGPFTLEINPAVVSVASPMSEFCIVPPFLRPEIKPNLLLEIDNSASMFDLVYSDKGNLPDRAPFYCYDQTFDDDDNLYAGYFIFEVDGVPTTEIYSYNFTDERFEPGASFPGTCAREISGKLCIEGTLSGTDLTSVTGFYATGEYLNWLTASKFDVEKEILTGGKFDVITNELIAESRGCVGGRFIKEALTADYVEGGPNTPLGVTFGVRGPFHPVNPTAPSEGGQTFIDVFNGDYLEGPCQDAIRLFNLPLTECNHSCRRTAAQACLQSSSSDISYADKIKNVFIQTVQECWQYEDEGSVGIPDAANTIKNQCPDVYDGLAPGTCENDSGIACNVDQDCSGVGGICNAGPHAVLPGNPALVCSSSFAGYCYDNVSYPFNNNGFISREYATEIDCITAKHNDYCALFLYPEVIDPTDDTAATETYGNVPSLLAHLSLESQLGEPLRSLRVRVQSNAVPTGVIQDYSDLIRIGAISFNFKGSSSECTKEVDENFPIDQLKCPKVCSLSTNLSCTNNTDCPVGETCENLDVVSSIKVCSDDIRQTCTVDADCVGTCETRNIEDLDGARVVSPIGESAGNHNSGLVKTIDDLDASAWTPFAEGLYNAVAYYSQNSDGTDDSNTMPVRLNSSDFLSTDAGDAGAENPRQILCQENHVVLISDGMSTADLHTDVIDFATEYNDGTGSVTAAGASTSVDDVPTYFGSANLDDVAWYAQNKNISDGSDTITKPSHTIKTHVVYSGVPCDSVSGVTKDATTGDCDSDDETISEVLMQATATNGAGKYVLADDPASLKAGLENLFEDIAGVAASGTAASVLASGEGSGANLVQALFYPTRTFGDEQIRWIGRLSNLWYFVDPFFGGAAIYEDNGATSSNVLDLTEDYRLALSYDTAEEKSKATRFNDDDDDGVADQNVGTVDFEAVDALWEAGTELFKRSYSDRKIFTKIDGWAGLGDFSTANQAALSDYLQLGGADATDLIEWVQGKHVGGSYRNRQVRIDLNNDGDTTDAGEENVWKLGDIIQSTPRIASPFQLNFYDQLYGDATYATFIGNASPVGYRDRQIVFTGANDGMLHAFKLGELEVEWAGQGEFEKARLLPVAGTDFGKELWAFIPKHVLPYLKFMSESDYCHVYSVDLSPYIFDASIGVDAAVPIADQPGCSAADYHKCKKTENTWRTILIGGMRLGGACKPSDADTTVCPDRSGDGVQDCVKAPGVDFGGDGSVTTVQEKTLGMSNYFALDITDTLQYPDDPTNHPPVLLWEFVHPALGLTSPGPVIIKINTKLSDINGDGKYNGLDPSDTDKNGRWFVVFASGPTGPISPADHQFLGRSNQNLRLFVRDLKSGAAVKTVDTGIANAFAGSMLNSNDDLDKDYQDDVFYIPFIKRDDTTGPNYTWTEGGVIRVTTFEDIDPQLDRWKGSVVKNGIGPVSSAVVRLFHPRRGEQWAFFGTGRYYFEKDTPDDAAGQQTLFGIKDKCYDPAEPLGFKDPCPVTGALIDVSDVANVPTNPAVISAMNGWKIDLEIPSDEPGWRSERVITDPLAVSTGLVFFTTFKPKDDSCDPEGKSFIWSARYDTGGAPGALLKGKALLQVSTGNIEQIDLGAAFTEKGKRRTAQLLGVPPVSQGLSILTTPPPVMEMIHMRER